MEQTNHGSSSVKKRCTRSSSIQTTYLRTSKHKPDLISALPDSLLLHILTLLDMDQVIKTSLLSRRWRYLWKSIPCLCFKPSAKLSEEIELTNFIDRCLFHHEGSKIRKLHIIFNYDIDGTHDPLVDSWIHFAIRRKVEDFKLHLVGGGFLDDDSMYDEFYKLPRSLYSCTTLTSLTLYGCNLNLPESFRLGSLEKLSLEFLELYSDSIEHISSSCPLLEDIYLKDCNRGRDLNIVITNEHVKRLEIRDSRECKFGTVKINAPSLLSLGFSNSLPREKYHFEEVGSLLSADIVCEEMLSGYYEEMLLDKCGSNDLGGLLYGLRHVKHLKLCGWFLQILSVREVRRVNPLSIKATSVELQTRLLQWELPGIHYLLKSCSNLENLKINGQLRNSYHTQLSYQFMGKYDFDQEGYWDSVGTDLPSMLQNIKTIKINGQCCFIQAFVRFLLKKSKVLERMVISTPKRYNNDFEKLFKLTQRLIVLPRSSPNAEVFIT